MAPRLLHTWWTLCLLTLTHELWVGIGVVDTGIRIINSHLLPVLLLLALALALDLRNQRHSSRPLNRRPRIHTRPDMLLRILRPLRMTHTRKQGSLRLSKMLPRGQLRLLQGRRGPEGQIHCPR